VLAIPDLEAGVVSVVGLVLMSIGMVKVGGCGERSDARRRVISELSLSLLYLTDLYFDVYTT
jgi:hypothetical protein